MTVLSEIRDKTFVAAVLAVKYLMTLVVKMSFWGFLRPLYMKAAKKKSNRKTIQLEMESWDIKSAISRLRVDLRNANLQAKANMKKAAQQELIPVQMRKEISTFDNICQLPPDIT